MTMDIESAKLAKQVAEAEIMAILKKLANDTGLSVTGVTVHVENWYSITSKEPVGVISKVEISMRL